MNLEAIKKIQNKGIECLNIEHGKQIIEFYKSIGFDTKDYVGSRTQDDGDVYRYYGLINNIFDNRNAFSYTEIITLEQAKELIKEKTFPRVMWVWDNHEDLAKKRVVFAYKCYKYIAWGTSETIEGSEKELDSYVWNHAKEVEVEQPKLLELTIEDIANKFGVSAEQIKIKK